MRLRKDMGKIKKRRDKMAKVNLLDLANEAQKDYDATIVLARVNGKLKELFKDIEAEDLANVSWVTTKESAGMLALRSSATFLLLKAIKDVYKDDITRVCVEYSISKGYYCSVAGNIVVNDEFIRRVSSKMNELVERKLPFKKMNIGVDEAIKLFEEQKMPDKVKLFRYRRVSKVNVYELDGCYDYFYGYLVPDTGYLTTWSLHSYRGGLVLQLPEKSNPDVVPEFAPQAKLFDTLDWSTKWGQKLGCENVGDLNGAIASGDIKELILVHEALMEKKVAEIASMIAEKPTVKFVMIAGPSSSGKTTFSHRLSVQLRTHGLKPHPIELDNYFVNREFTPKDENGNYNFECLEAIDVEQLNKDMQGLLAGETVEIPRFNFKTGKREYKGDFKKLGPNDILVLEGIHGLNDKLTYSLDPKSKFKIYISALTQLNIDEHNRIPTTDGRLLRRMVRDARTRGASAQKTIGMWASVRKGEEENIFPYQESADVMFNSALIYELAVLKQFAEPLLFGIKPEEPEYEEAKRLLKFLDYFLGISSENLPNNSIIREFIGGSTFNV